MSLLRDGADNSINFQKASCTLDGCVKIWTSRVDSVATETGKLLSGLGDDARASSLPLLSLLFLLSSPSLTPCAHSGRRRRQRGRRRRRGRRAPGEACAQAGPSSSLTPPSPLALALTSLSHRPQAARQAATLADDFSKLRVKSFDLEFTVDPLFKKTSADFDEGGAGGILMNHLACDGTMKVVFDAGDAKLECDEEDALDEADEEDKARQRAQDEEDRAEIDISKLQGAPALPHPLDSAWEEY